MIKSKGDLKEYINQDMPFYNEFYSKKDKLILWFCKDPVYYIKKYLKYLRKEEYYSNCGKTPVATLLYFINFRKKNALGNKLGFKIPKNTFGPGLSIYHHGEIIVNESARIGANAKLHGGNCIGNNGKTDIPPVIGDNLDLGIGAKIIGDVTLGDNVKIGANAVVTKSFEENGVTLVGLPARKV